MGITDYSLDEIEAIIEDEPRSTPYPPIEQHGPLRYFDNEMRCASRRCGSSTHYKVLGIPNCTVHALKRLNELLMERGLT